MMQSGWHWFVVILTLVNIAACWWLIVWSGKHHDDSGEDGEMLENRWDGDLQERNNPLPRWWLFLFIGTIIWSVGYLIYYPGLGNFEGVSGWTQLEQYEDERARVDAIYHEKFSRLAAMDYSELAADANAMDIAGRLFGNYCATCHGADAGGATGFPSLRDDDWIYGSDAAAITQTISNGRNGIMPGWEAAAGGEEGVQELVAYVKQLSGKPHDGEQAAAGKTRYMTLCVACHGADGKGVKALGGMNLTDDIWVHGDSDEAISHSIALGRTGQMPAHAELLSEEEIKLLVAYVQSLGGS